MSDPLDGKSYMLQMADEISRLRAELDAANERTQSATLRASEWMKMHAAIGAERDALRAKLAAAERLANDRLTVIHILTRERDEARAELAAARAALEPFALRECKWGSKVYKINVTMDPQWIANARAVLAKEGKDE